MTVLDRFRLDGACAVVTAAGRGIGAAVAVALAEAGADVVVAARRRADLDQVASDVATQGRRAVVVATDLAEEEALTGLVTTASTEFGRLDVVVNNLGGTMPRALLDTTTGYLERAFHFNVGTAHALLRAAAPVMLAGRGGTVVNISSVAGQAPSRGFAAYGTAKAALTHYTRMAAADLAPRIRVNAVAVGTAATAALETVLADDDARRRLESVVPLRRIADPSEIAAAVLFLASPASSYVTGAVLGVDGGGHRSGLDLGLGDL